MGPEHGKILAMDIARTLFQVVIDLFSLLFSSHEAEVSWLLKLYFFANNSPCIKSEASSPAESILQPSSH